MSLKHILNDDPPLHSPQPVPQPHPPSANSNGASTLVVPPQAPAPLSPSSQHPRDARSPSDVRNGDPAPPSREYLYHPQPGAPYQAGAVPAPARWEYHNGDRLQADDIPSGPSSSYQGEPEESATPSPRISNGTPVGLNKEGSVEGNGRVLRKRKLPDDDEDYQPPGQKRVSGFHGSRLRGTCC